jgi:hypothetical protein
MSSSLLLGKNRNHTVIETYAMESEVSKNPAIGLRSHSTLTKSKFIIYN